MPEGHTVHRLAAAFARGFGGQRVRTSSPQGRFSDAAQLDGQVLLGAEAVGKHLFLPFAPTADVDPADPSVRHVHVHLGLYGSWTFAGDPGFIDAHAIGAPRLRVGERTDEWADVTVESGQKLSDRKGVAVPEAVIPVSALTPKDREDLAFALRMGVDWVALSFVQKPEDMAELKRIVNGQAACLAKIEKPAGISNPKDFRNEIVNFVLRARANNNGKNPTWLSYEKLRVVIEKKMFSNTEDLLPVISFNAKASKEDQKKHNDFVVRMVERGYTEKQVRLLSEWYLRVRKSQ